MESLPLSRGPISPTKSQQFPQQSTDFLQHPELGQSTVDFTGPMVTRLISRWSDEDCTGGRKGSRGKPSAVASGYRSSLRGLSSRPAPVKSISSSALY